MQRDQLVWHTIYDTIRIGILPTDDVSFRAEHLPLLQPKALLMQLKLHSTDHMVSRSFLLCTI